MTLMYLFTFQDTEVVIWDVIAEKGLHRLSGHKGTVTAVQFINKFNIVATASKDTYIKFWDLTSGHCFKTLAGHITEVRTFLKFEKKKTQVNILLYLFN